MAHENLLAILAHEIKPVLAGDNSGKGGGTNSARAGGARSGKGDLA